MNYDEDYLHNIYNATSIDNGTGEIETYKNWLERQFISRLKHIDELEKNLPNESKTINRNEQKEKVNSYTELDIVDETVVPKCRLCGQIIR